MKKRLIALLLVLVLTCGAVPAAAVGGLLIAPAPTRDPWGITLTAKDVTPTGLTLNITRYGGNPTGDLETGAEFWLEVHQNGRWQPLPLLHEDLTWIAIAYGLPDGENRDFALNWEHLYGPLYAGEYRVGKRIMDFRGAGDYDEKNYYATFTISPADVENPFTDVTASDDFYEAVDYVRRRGLMQGKTETVFDPNGTVTRGQLTTILWRLKGEPVVNYIMPFTDVKQKFYYAEAIRWAAAEKIINGYEDGTFRPDAPISRQQLTAILWRYARYAGYDVSVGEDTNILSYEDAFTISEYAIPAIQWACGAGVMTGENGWLYPAEAASRAVTAQFLKNFLA